MMLRGDSGSYDVPTAATNGHHTYGYSDALGPGTAAAPGSALKDLLAQVAPQARIKDGAAQSRASARILSKVVSESAGFRSNGQGPLAFEPQRQPYEMPHAELWHDGARSKTDWLQEAAPKVPFRSRWSGETAVEEDEIEEEDDRFMERWTGLFSESSPLVTGTATDPFKDDLRKRDKVIWKSMNQRPGHHSRYQERRKQRSGDSQGHQRSTDEGVSLVFDAGSSEHQ